MGAPYDNRNGGVGQGAGMAVAGYIYQTTDTHGAPVADTFTNLLGTPGGGTTGPMILQWSNTATQGNMMYGNSSQYMYRPVAAGIRITPLDSVTKVGGCIDSVVIPFAANEAYCSSLAVGSPQFDDKILGLPGHHVKRGTDTFEVRWLPSQVDYTFSITSAYGNSATQNDLIKSGNNARCWVKITPADSAVATKYRVEYIGFYEIAGACTMPSATVCSSLPGVS